MIRKKNALLLIVATMLLTACGGGGGGGGTPSSTTTGKVVDGYIENASVFCDTDDNGGTPDPGEEVVTTDSQGNFTFSSACTGNIVASGGTDIATGLPLKSVFVAPPGSSVVTVVTTLLTGTLTNAQVASFVGLPAGTNLLTLDPAATNSDGSLQNPSLMQRTLAIQQVVQQIMNTVGMLGHDSTTPTLQAISTEVGNAVISVAASNPSTSLIDSNGSVSTSLVNSIVQHAISNVSASSNSALSTLKATIGTFSPSSVADAASTAISVEAQELATASNSNTLTAALQSNVAVSNALSQVAPLLTLAQEDNVDMSTFGANLGSWATALLAGDSAGQNAAAASAAATVATQSANAGLSVTFDANTLTSPTNYLAILNDTITINGTDFTLTQFHNGLSVVGSSDASLDTIGFTFSVVGTPIPANANGVKTGSISLGIELADTATGQLAQIMINQVNITIDSQNKISINVPANATAYVYGKTASGATANLTLVNVGADTASVVNNLVTFNAGIVFDKIASAIEGDSAAQAVFGSLQHIKGTFNTKVVMSVVDLRNQDGTSAPGLSLSVIGSGQAPLGGLGEQGVITIQ